MKFACDRFEERLYHEIVRAPLFKTPQRFCCNEDDAVQMRLTTKGRYAVQALADITAHGAAGPVSLSEIALRQGISSGYLDQLFGKLRRAGMVESVRGVAGGYRLARAARDIRIADIVAAADEEIKTTACGGKSTGCRGASARCLTHDLWDELGRQIDIFLNAVSLEDVVERRVLGMAAVNAPSKPADNVAGGDIDQARRPAVLLGAAE